MIFADTVFSHFVFKSKLHWIETRKYRNEREKKQQKKHHQDEADEKATATRIKEIH